MRAISALTEREIRTAATRRRGAERSPRIEPETTICVAVRFDSAKLPLPLSWPSIAMAATLRPMAKEVIMLTTGSENVTALATRVPATLLMKRPSIRGIMDCTTPSMRVGTARKRIVRDVDSPRIMSRRWAVD